MIARALRNMPVFALAITMLGAVSGCSSGPVKESAAARPQASAGTRLGDRVARVALQQVGAPYRYGGNDPNGFDCSGLVQYSYGRAGKAVPRTTSQLWAATLPVTPDKLRDGDLVFFDVDGKMSHVGLYVGDRQFVHAPQSGRTVTVASLDSPYYRRAFARAGRPK